MARQNGVLLRQGYWMCLILHGVDVELEPSVLQDADKHGQNPTDYGMSSGSFDERGMRKSCASSTCGKR